MAQTYSTIPEDERFDRSCSIDVDVIDKKTGRRRAHAAEDLESISRLVPTPSSSASHVRISIPIRPCAHAADANAGLTSQRVRHYSIPSILQAASADLSTAAIGAGLQQRVVNTTLEQDS